MVFINFFTVRSDVYEKLTNSEIQIRGKGD
jgi:hypothetical protein